MFAIIVDIVVKKEFVHQFRENILRQGENSRTKEPGCVAFEILQDPDDPTRFTLYEAYTDKAAFNDIHRNTPYFVLYAETTGPWVVEKNVRVLNKIWPK